MSKPLKMPPIKLACIRVPQLFCYLLGHLTTFQLAQAKQVTVLIGDPTPGTQEHSTCVD